MKKLSCCSMQNGKTKGRRERNAHERCQSVLSIGTRHMSIAGTTATPKLHSVSKEAHELRHRSQAGRQTDYAQRDFCHVEPLQGKKGRGLACRNCSVDRDRHTTITTPELSGENSDVSQSRTRMMTMIITTTLKYRRDRIRAPLL
jgi:hypothetical protein